MNDTIQVNYDALETVAKKFMAEAEALEYIRRKLVYQFDALIPDGWEGDAARAFEWEMTNAVLPSLRRMIEALEDACYTTRKIGEVMENAEEEAAAQFNMYGLS